MFCGFCKFNCPWRRSGNVHQKPVRASVQLCGRTHEPVRDKWQWRYCSCKRAALYSSASRFMIVWTGSILFIAEAICPISSSPFIVSP